MRTISGVDGDSRFKLANGNESFVGRAHVVHLIWVNTDGSVLWSRRRSMHTRPTDRFAETRHPFSGGVSPASGDGRDDCAPDVLLGAPRCHSPHGEFGRLCGVETSLSMTQQASQMRLTSKLALPLSVRRSALQWEA